MKLVILYGPPAVGKLTVAQELATLTKFKIFHNHLTVDFLDPIIRYGTEGFFQLLDRIRLAIFETAAKQELPGMIFTFVYAKGHDDEFIRKAIITIENNGGEIHLVRLHCDEKELLKRVVEPSRQEFRKIKTIDALKKNLADDDLTSSVPFGNNFNLDNTSLSAKQAAESIIDHFKLNTTKK